MNDLILWCILLGFGAIFTVILILIYRKLNINNDNSDLREKIIEIITQKYSKIEERVSELKEAQKEVVDFKNIFTNKTERGKLGEDWLEDIIKDAISKKHYKRQHTFTNGKRVDFLLNFGSSNERISIDSKFTWENYKKWLEAKDDSLKKQHTRDFVDDINKHINAVSEYIINGETAPIALMFVASEGVFRTIEASPQNFIKKARAKNVIIV